MFVGSYLPGVRSGGPIRSISNMAARLGDDFDFRIVTRDREEADKSFRGIEADRWMPVGKARVLYLSPENLSFRTLHRIMVDERADFLYLNSFFSRMFSALPLLARELGAKGQSQVVLAPRGEFSPGALQLRRLKKQLFLAVAKSLPAYRRLIWHASTQYEERDIRTQFGGAATIRTALPISDLGPCLLSDDLPFKQQDSLKVVFLGRVVPKKNLDFAIRTLRGLKGQIEFTIAGPVEDAVHWNRCRAEIDKLADNIKVNIMPLVPHEKVAEVFRAHHVFLFPTLGENYGHTICEALTAGCPAIVSDRTPWRNLQQAGAGFDLPLEDPELFHRALQFYLKMGNADFRDASRGAMAFASRFTSGADPTSATQALFTP